MPMLRLFASAREAAGVARTEIDAATVGELLDEARRRFGGGFASVLETSRVWVNGQPADPATPIEGHDVVAVLPPVSGGANASGATAGAGRGGGPTAGTRAGGDAPQGRRLQLVRAPVGTDGGWSGTSPAHSPDALARVPLVVVPPLPDELAEEAHAPAPAPVPSAPPRPRTKLAVVHQSVRPHGRLGMLWAAVTAGAVVAGTGWLAAWFAVGGLVAASQVCRVWVRRGERPLPAFAAAAAAALPLTAAAGIQSVNAAIVATVVLTLVARMFFPTRAPLRDVGLTLLIGVSIGLAVAAPVLLRHVSLTATFFLLGCAAVYDAGAYLVGTGASSAWEGPVAGVAALIPVTMLAAVVFVPPFSGAEPLLLGALAAALAPIGPVAGSVLLGDRTSNAPGLRRLDSLLILGPIWAWCAFALLIR
jgi:sulfur-carrier protein